MFIHTRAIQNNCEYCLLKGRMMIYRRLITIFKKLELHSI